MKEKNRERNSPGVDIMMLRAIIGKIMPPTDVHILIPGTDDCVT